MKVLGSSKVSGISITRNENGDIIQENRVLSVNGSIQGTIDRPSQEVKKDNSFSSNISCGNIQSGRPTADSSSRKRPLKHFPKAQAVPSKVSKPTPEEPDCTDLGLIVASSNGFSLIIIGDHYSLSELKWLGSNPDDSCIEYNVGHVIRFEDNSYINCMPARWSYEDGERKFFMSSKVDQVCLRPFLGSYKYEDFTHMNREYTGIPQYGYTIPIYQSNDKFASVCRLSGVSLTLSYIWFSRDSIALVNLGRDYEDVFDSIGWDALNFGNTGTPATIRYRTIKNDLECPAEIAPSDNIPARSLYLLNSERKCEVGNLPLVTDYSAYELADYYADRMATYEFVDHIDQEDGSTLEQRADTFNLERTELAEVLGSVDDPGLSDPTENKDAVCDLMQDEFMNFDYDAAVSSLYFRGGISIRQNVTSEKWYGCAILRTLETDSNTYQNQYVYLGQSPDVNDGSLEDNEYYQVIAKGNSYRAFYTAPLDKLYVSCLTRQWWDGYSIILGEYLSTRFKDNYSHALYSSSAIEGGSTTPIPVGSKVIDWPFVLLTNGGWIRAESGSKEWYFQYDGNTNNSIKVVCDIIPQTVGDASNQPQEYTHRTSACLEYEETEPTITGNQGGNTSLYLGALVVDTAQRIYNSGDNPNPYQTLNVASVFHTVSGYKAITYTVIKTLANEYWKWDAGSNRVYERYYWLKIELWAAIISPTNTLIARWKLGSMPAGTDSSLTYTDETLELVQTVDNKRFIFEYNKPLKAGTVEVYCNIGAYPVKFTDSKNGFLLEDEFQHPDQQYLLLASSINYDSGVVDLEFSNRAPDTGATVFCFSKAGDPAEVLKDFAQYSEIVMYSDDEKYQNAYVVGSCGHAPEAPSLTITEDGNYAVFGVRSANIEIERVSRVLSGDPLTGVPRSSINYMYNYEESPYQVAVFDITQVTADKPKIVMYPTFINDESESTECLVLN